MITYRDGLENLPVYDVVERDWDIKINANESNLNLPPLVEERVLNRLARVAFNRYPNEEADDLKSLIAANFSLKTENVLLGNGSSEILEKLFHAFGGAGRKIVYPVPSFSMYKIYAKLSESDAVPVELNADYSLDAEKFIAAVKDNDAKMLVICTPNNPTGNVVPKAAIEHIAQNIACPFVIDEAYVEFYGVSVAEFVKKYPHVIVARTFSKAYGMAAARIGYMLASEEITKMVGRVTMPYHANVLTLAAAAIVYQMRDEFVPRIQMYVAERKRLGEEFKKMGFSVYPSETNFILVKIAKAAEYNAYLERANVGVRSFGDAPRLENCLRITVGTREENDRLLKLTKEFLAEG
jgi:histidinol-phosphate aminotransferase